MTDREMLELAAKAAGIGPAIGFEDGGLVIGPRSRQRFWSPLAKNEDAFRLAVRLHIDLELNNGSATAIWIDSDLSEAHSVTEVCDEWFEGWEAKEAATRRAITRAAAEIQITRGGD